MKNSDYAALLEAFQATEGFRIYQLRKTIGISFHTFGANQRELLSFLNRHSDPATFPNYDRIVNRNMLNQEFREAIRLLHNYCASTMSLVDHTRRVARKTLDGVHLETYHEQIDIRFKSNPEHCFLQELRNYLLHHSNAPISRVIRFEPTHVQAVGIQFSTEDLLKWKWKSIARKFIQSHDDGVEIEPVITSYGKSVVNFLDWLHHFIENSRSAEFKELFCKHEEWLDFCSSKGIPTTEEEFRKVYGGDAQ